MFQRILVPLDGSARAERALTVAAQLARARNATLALLRVVPDLLDVGGYMVPAVATDSGAAEREEFEARDYLSAIAKRPVLNGLHVEQVVGFGVPAQVILDTIKSSAIDGVIIGSHGRTGLSRWVMGSIAQAVVRHATAPVLLLRQQGPALDELDGRERPFRILLPLDGSELAEAAIAPAQVMGEAFSAMGTYEIHLARVIPFISTAAPDPLRDAARAEATAQLERVAQQVTAATNGKALVTTSVIMEIDVADALARMTRAGELVTGSLISDGCDLIAMATHGRTGLARLAIGSVTERVLSATIAPALIIRPERMKIEAQPKAATGEPAKVEESWPALF